MNEKKPTIGRIVIFTLPSPEHPTANNDAKEVPAIITRVWSDTCVNLTVFADAREPITFSSSQYSKDAAPCTWRWSDDVVETKVVDETPTTPVAPEGGEAVKTETTATNDGGEEVKTETQETH